MATLVAGFGPTQKTNALTTATSSLKVTADVDDEIDFAIAGLARDVLVNQRLVDRARSDNTLLASVQTLPELIQPWIERLATNTKRATDIQIIKFKAVTQSKHWTDSRS